MKYLFYVLTCTATLVSCSEFLEERPDKSLATPDNLQDLQALLDYENSLNMGYPAAGDIAADYFFLSEADWQSRDIDARNTYIRAEDAQNEIDWNNAYQRIFQSNVVLDAVDEAMPGNMTEKDRQTIRGSALFFRAFSYFQLSQLYCPFYHLGMQHNEFGLPLKLQSDINEPIVRSSLKDTYAQIFSDLERASELLSATSSVPMRPSRAAAYGLLARLYLIIGNNDEALRYAEACLAISDRILDYNTLDTTSNLPIPLFNEEVIFHAVTNATTGVHDQTVAYVDSTLVGKYAQNDLRRKIFLKEDETGYYRFKGSYEGANLALFCGLATDEIYLIKSEALARKGEDELALVTLNQLLRNRWKTNTYVDLQNLSGNDLIAVILLEREKELLFRGGIRWSDLRRLNRESNFQKVLTRRLGQEIYELKPEELRYTFLLPWPVLEMNGMKQNQR